jgi:hypothetical protein
VKIEIRHRLTKSVIYETEAKDLRAAVVGAVMRGAYLGGADLGGADLGGADLGGADLGGAYLRGAYLGGADLGGADLGGADLGGAYLRGADLRGAYLGGAYLGGAYLRGADLRGAYLRGAKGYQDSHDIFFEVISRQKAEEITTEEWSMVGVSAIHRICWGSIRKCFGEAIVPLFQKVAGWGFGEYLERYQQEK